MAKSFVPMDLYWVTKRRRWNDETNTSSKEIMKKKLAIVFGVLCLTSMVRAAHIWEDPGDWWGGHFKYERDMTDMYAANELTLDTYGSYILGPGRGQPNHERWGAGVGLNYFFLKYLGLGAEADGAANGGHLIDSVSASLIARLPIEHTGLAPYAFGGGGRTTDQTWNWTAHVGGGLELRLNPNLGFFVDARWVFVDKRSDNGLARAGLRFAF